MPDSTPSTLIPPGGRDTLPQSDDEILGVFLDHVIALGITPYPAQEEAILELCSGSNVILNTPTGSGKSLVAAAMHFRSICLGRRSVYTCPIKALVNEKFLALCREFGPEHVGMMTGDATVNRDAPILCCTAEILANVALREGAEAKFDDVIMDEFHYYSDPDRGGAWQIPLLTMSGARFLLMSATLGETGFFVDELTQLTGARTALVQSTERPVPLEFLYEQETLQDVAEKYASSPVYVVHFTQRGAAETASSLLSINFCSKEEKKAIAAAIRGEKFSSPYGKEIKKLVRHGIGLHHAGILPKHRLLVEKLVQQGLLKVVCGTDTLGVGINVPISTVVFTQLFKYDGTSTAILKSRDFHQVAGRAGRAGYDTMGRVISIPPLHVIENLRLEQKAAANPNKKRKIVRKKPPEKGFVNWDEKTFRKIIDAPPEPLVSSFQISHGMLLNVLSRENEDGVEAMRKLIRDCHEPAARKPALRRRAFELARSLIEADILEVLPREERTPTRNVRVAVELQDDFSLNQSLSLYLIDSLTLLDPASDEYALDLLSFVEAIIEDPRIVLMKQLDRAKTEKMNQMKADGVEYEARIEALEDVEYPKPNRELIYNSFNDFSELHPWVGTENIRPKSIAREIFEDYHSFTSYVHAYGLLRSEGVLLRYLSQVHKCLKQTVPASFKDEQLIEIEVFLDAMIRETDASLLEEWEALADPDGESGEDKAPAAKAAPVKADITRNQSEFVIRVRNATFHLLRALGTAQWDDALLLLDPSEGESEAGPIPWNVLKVRQLAEAFLEEHQWIDFDTHARNPAYFRHEVKGDSWEVEQILLSEGEPTEWSLHVRIDLAACRAEDRVALELIDLRKS